MVTVGESIGKDQRRLQYEDEGQIGIEGNLSYFENPEETIYVDPSSIRIDKVTPNLTQSWIVGHPGGTAAIVGTALVGFVETSHVRIIESKFWEDFTEGFTSTTYKNSSVTTANWTTTGSLGFVSGSVAQSLNIGSDIELSTTKFNRMKLSITGSSNWINSVGSVSSDGGDNWFGVKYDVWQELPSGSTGSEPMWRIVDSTQSTSISEVIVNYKQDDI
jgi:hypothetical protein